MNKNLYGTIVDVDIKEDGSAFAKVQIDGNIIGDTNNADEIQKSFIETPSINQTEVHFKSLKVSQDAPSMVKTSNNYSAIIGSANNRIVSSEKYGNFILGPTTFNSHPENIRVGGVYRLNGLLTSTMPSTIVTPIPVLVFDFPMVQAVKGMKDILKIHTDLIKEVLV